MPHVNGSPPDSIGGGTGQFYLNWTGSEVCWNQLGNMSCIHFFFHPYIGTFECLYVQSFNTFTVVFTSSLVLLMFFFSSFCQFSFFFWVAIWTVAPTPFYVEQFVHWRALNSSNCFTQGQKGNDYRFCPQVHTSYLYFKKGCLQWLFST